ncbi:hypothetical protein BD410DRAFT_773568 [Rickenella mellea]|uniref:CHAT domain-containing protein n=1 Tax=Rickenella mellea TaxID=50990 RepID=A0A4Y7PXB5_9AGAM|nr:hypothetical protein BD410DRAFT_773568 [Rickenella mellea]
MTTESATTVPGNFNGENPALDADLQQGLHITQEDDESSGLSDDDTDITSETLRLELLAQVLPDNEEDKPDVLYSLGLLLTQHFEATGAVENIEKAIMHQEQGVMLTPDGHPNMPDLEKAISNHERAVLLTPDGHPDMPRQLNSLGISLQIRFKHLGEMEDLEKSISNHERAVLLTPDGHPNMPGQLNELGNSFHTRFEQLGAMEDLEKSISNNEKAVLLTPDGHSDMPSLLSNLGNSLQTRFEQLGEMNDLEKAISNQERAVLLTPDGHPDMSGQLNNLGSLLQSRFEQLGEMEDIEKAISNKERAVLLTPDGHPDMPHRLNSLGISLQIHFKHLGEMEDLEKSISNHERAVLLTPDGHPNMPSQLNNLGNSLGIRFEQLGAMEDLEKSIANHERAMLLTPDGHPNMSGRLSNLGISLQTRFEHLGEMEDLEKAISNYERAVLLTPDGHPDMPHELNSLGISLQIRFEHWGEMEDLEKSIANHERAVLLTPDGHPDMPGQLNELGNSFHTRFEQLGAMEDLEKSISNNEKAVLLTPDGHSDMPGLLNNLGNSLATRFKHLGEMADLEKAMSNNEKAVLLTPNGHPDMPSWLNNFGTTLRTRFNHLGKIEDLEKAIYMYSKSANQIGSPYQKFLAAILWAQCTHTLQHPDSTFQAYSTAFQILPQLCWPGLTIASRHRALQLARFVACDSAAAALSADNFNQALEWLEQGRSVVWGQLLQLQNPMDDLRAIDLDLAERLSHVAFALEQGGYKENRMVTESDVKMSSSQAISKYHRLANEWDSLVKVAQKKPGFKHFMLPKKISELQQAAFHCPVVILNISKYRCDALIVESPSEPPHQVHFNDFTYAKAKSLQITLQKILSDEGIRDRMEDRHGGPAFEEGSDANAAFRHLLEELWKSVVKPVLDCLKSCQIQTENDLFHICWCPTGPLMFLPIHAAGLYNADGSASVSLADVAVSSYTPTLSALLNRSPQKDKTPAFKFLAIIQPNTPGARRLPGTVEELKCIQNHVPTSSLRILNGPDATTTTVLSSMEECSWVHLACHGVQDASDPMKSGLLLQDGRLHLSKIIQKHITHGEFAFLSACQTATGDERRPEEAIHLAAGMLVAGFKGVIGTMWSIRDNDAPFVADKVYGRLLKNGKPSGVYPAVALHEAVQELRKRSGPNFSLWVPFIYMGA